MSDEILKALLDIKEDTGQTRAKVDALEGWLTSHVAEDRIAHERIRRMELSRAHSSGRASVWHIIAVGAGSALGWIAQFAYTWFKSKGAP